MLVVTAFSLIIHYRAQAVRLPRDEMMVVVNKQAAVHGEAVSTAGAG